MARPRSAGFDDHRRGILEVAAALFASKGYLGTSVNEVAEACGITKPTLYHYFRDKEDLLLQIADEHVTALVGLTQLVMASHEPGEARLRELVHRFLAAYSGARNKHRVLTEAVRYLQPDDRARVLDKERQVVRAFAEAIGDMRPDLRGQHLETPLAMLIFGMINWMFTWWRPDGPLGPGELSRMVDEFICGGLANLSAPSAPKAGRKTASRRRAPVRSES